MLDSRDGTVVGCGITLHKQSARRARTRLCGSAQSRTGEAQLAHGGVCATTQPRQEADMSRSEIAVISKLARPISLSTSTTARAPSSAPCVV
jgi:hypothetical protein